MSEWWTYRPADFLMFSPRIYWRLFESINAAFWPWQLLWLAAAVAAVASVAALTAGGAGCAGGAAGGAAAGEARRPVAAGGLAAGLAAACGLVAGAFLLQRFAAIQSIATHYAAAWAVQALLLAVLAVAGGNAVAASDRRSAAGLVLAAWALLAHPLLAPLAGRPWSQAEVVGLAPDPTAILVLGWLLATRAAARPATLLRRLLGLSALAWCAVSAATLWTMGSAQGWVPALAAAAAVVATLRRGVRDDGGSSS